MKRTARFAKDTEDAKKKFLASAGKMRKPKGFTTDAGVLCARSGTGSLLESSFFPAFQNVFLGEPGVLSDQRERAV